MSNTYVDVNTADEIPLVDLQANEGLTWDGKYYYSLKSNDLIKSDPVAGEIKRVTLVPASGGSYEGVASLEKRLALIEDDGAGTCFLVIIDTDGSTVHRLKIGSDFKRLSFLDKRLYTIRKDENICELAVDGTVQRTDFYTSVFGRGLDGITNDGKYLYISSATNRDITKIDLAGTFMRSISPGTSPVGDITFSGRYIVNTV